MANKYSADIPKGFNVPKQVRLDSITGIQNEETLKDLGFGNNLAFKYYENLKIYCKDEKTEYIWREVVGSETGLLDTHFVYPTYTPVDGINYSGKSFNFFLIPNNIEPADGSETKLIEGTNVTITGTGTTLDPYEISSSFETSQTYIEEGDNINITGTGIISDPFIINADLTDLGIVKTIDNEVIAPEQTLSIINSEITGKVLATKEYVESVIPSTPDGSETKINAGDNINITGTGTSSSPYIINAINNQLATKEEFNDSLTDGDFLFVGDIINYTDENAQNAIGDILLDTSTIDLLYNDGVPSISAAIKVNSIDASYLSDTINISEFINDSDYTTNASLNIVRSEIDNVKSQINPNTYVITDNGNSLVINDFTLNSGWSWMINGINYTNSSSVVLNIPLATSGYSRIDLIVLTSSSVAVRVPGVESAGTAASPTIPLNTIAIASIFSDSILHTVTIPKPKYPVSQFIRNGITDYSPSEDVLFDALGLKANLASPNFTGISTAPTATAGTNTTQIATTAFVLANQSFSNDISINGVKVGRGNSIGANNTIVGELSANANTSGTYNTAIGQSALSLGSSGSFNTAIGGNALASNTGSDNSAIGISSMYSKTTGSGNVSIGTDSGRYISGGVSPITSVSYSVFLGESTKALADSGTNEIVIGSGATGAGSNTVTLGNTSITKTILQGVINTPKNYTVSTLPTGVQGDTTYVTDALAPTYMTTVVGGGAIVCPVFYNGTSWVAH